MFWTEPTATDNVEVRTLERSHAPGAVFSVAGSPHEVTYYAEDTSFNSASCTFLVIVDFERVPLQSAFEVEFEDIASHASYSVDLGAGVVQNTYVDQVLSPANRDPRFYSFSGSVFDANTIALSLQPSDGERFAVLFGDTEVRARFVVDLTFVRVVGEEEEEEEDGDSGLGTSSASSSTAATAQPQSTTATGTTEARSTTGAEHPDDPLADEQNSHELVTATLGLGNITEVATTDTETDGSDGSTSGSPFDGSTALPNSNGAGGGGGSSSSTSTGDDSASFYSDQNGDLTLKFTSSAESTIKFQESSGVWRAETVRVRGSSSIFTRSLTFSDISIGLDFPGLFTLPPAQAAIPSNSSSGSNSSDSTAPLTSSTFSPLLPSTTTAPGTTADQTQQQQQQQQRKRKRRRRFDGSAGDQIHAGTYVLTADSSVQVEYIFVRHSDADASTSRVNGFFTFEDDVPPTYGSTCPSDIVVTVPHDQGFAVVNWTAPTATDNRLVVSDIGSHTPPARFELQSVENSTYTVTYEAEDQAGSTATCAFRVALIDASPPVVTCPDMQEYVADAQSGTAELAAEFRTPQLVQDHGDTYEGNRSASAHAPIPSDFVVVPAKQTFAVGDSAAEISVTDGWGNTGTCTFVVRVVDVTPPVASNCPEVGPSGISQDGAPVTVPWSTVSWTDNDASANVSVTSSHEPGEEFSVGVTPVRIEAVDASGNSAVCAFNVTVAAVGSGSGNAGSSSALPTNVIVAIAASVVAVIVALCAVIGVLVVRARKRPHNFEAILEEMRQLKAMTGLGDASSSDGPVAPRELKRSYIRTLDVLGAVRLYKC